MRRQDFNRLIDSRSFDELFISEMGWNNPSNRMSLPIEIDGVDYDFQPVTEKSGFHVYSCVVEMMPTASECKKIDNKLRNYGYDYICIFTLGHTSHHLWLTPVKANEKRELVKTEYLDAKQADLLFSKIDDLSFDLDEHVLISDVKQRVQGSFRLNSEKITKDFYAQFRKEHTAFKKHIIGIDNEKKRDWYTSVMLNRLMFCYFIQKKGFLDQNTNYLQDKLRWVREHRGEDQFFGTFYKDFLCALFHEGLNNPSHEEKQEFVSAFGRIPYLNGGMFDDHQLEREYKGIDIPDEAFEKLFNFFDKWNWHLDTRLTASGKDINPDVLGYIFEQYINDRAAMGAYYTKEDITEYIGKNCIIPFLIDKTQKKSPKAFTPEGEVWQLLAGSGDRYIFDAVKKGYSPDWQQQIPDYIAQGLDTTDGTGLLERRARWNEKTHADFALPTEIWRETVERLQRCDTLRQKISGGEITAINDFITYNLDIRTFVEDVLRHTQDHHLVAHFYAALQGVTILDPTCGSGAFLFAALNILEPLYEVCIDRMEEFNHQNDKLFTQQLEEIRAKYSSNRQYFIYKSIILRNLYGVDIMVEATEIAKLRLFLKMVAVVEVDKRKDNLGLDPLPDIDFNIKCGNTLVGYATEAELNRGLVAQDLFEDEELKRSIHAEMNLVATAYGCFRSEQLKTYDDNASIKQTKQLLKEKLAKLNDLLNRRMFENETSGAGNYDAWLASHQPFHWLAEFYQIIKGNGGFDVIIGNPPYVVYNPRSYGYRVNNYATESCADLYAFVIEKAMIISNNRKYCGMIVPISIVSTDGFASLRKCISINLHHQWFSNYAIRPAKLFDGAEKRLTIFILNPSHLDSSLIFTTNFKRWYADERIFLFNTLHYAIIDNKSLYLNSIPKISGQTGLNIWHKVLSNELMSVNFSANKTDYIVYHTRKFGYYVQFLNEPPKIYNEDGSIRVTSELKSICFDSEEEKYSAIAVYLSTTFFWFFNTISDCRNLNKREVANFKFNLKLQSAIIKKELTKRGKEIIDNLQSNSNFIDVNYKKIGKLSLQVFQPKTTIPIANEIDKVLAKHYGFTDEELDFIINYDIKYRMGEELGGEE